MRTFNTQEALRTPLWERSSWKIYQPPALRFFVIFFGIQALPIDWKFYRDLLSIDISAFSFYDLFRLARYYPRFFGMDGFGNWAVTAVIALAGTAIWPAIIKKPVNPDVVYYWLRVVLRYRLAFGIIAYGLIKFFPMQMPYPSLSNLHTNYGDFFGWKIYYHTLGITPSYESFLGAVEIVAGILLLFRKTATIGAGIIIGFTGNVLAANIAYDAGEQFYSANLLAMALFLFAYDAPRLYRLLVLGKFTTANRFKPAFSKNDGVRIALKSIAGVLLLVMGVSTYAAYTRASYKLPATPALPGSYGFYNVREFRLNHKNIPYSTSDPDRWQNVIFEKWATISIKIARPVILDTTTGDAYSPDDLDRNFESAGVGGRHYYAYTSDTAAHTLTLRNKNKNHRSETYRLNYSFSGDSTIIVRGVNEKNDSIYAVLDRIGKKYMVKEGRRKRVKL